MKTGDLIALLAADGAPVPGVGARLARALLPALALSALALVLGLRVRPDLAQVLASAAVMKTVLPLLLALLALPMVARLSRPEGQARGALWLILALWGLVWLGFVAALGVQGPQEVVRLMSGPTALTCLISVPILSALPLAASLWAMRAGAPRNPRAAGAVAGLLSTGAATAIYTLHCPEDSLLFLPVYAVAMAAVISAGALIGGRVLRW